jgi:hypothetical protein
MKPKLIDRNFIIANSIIYFLQFTNILPKNVRTTPTKLFTRPHPLQNLCRLTIHNQTMGTLHRRDIMSNPLLHGEVMADKANPAGGQGQTNDVNDS